MHSTWLYSVILYTIKLLTKKKSSRHSKFDVSDQWTSTLINFEAVAKRCNKNRRCNYLYYMIIIKSHADGA